MVPTNCAYCGKRLKRWPYRLRERNYCGPTHQLRYEYEHRLRDTQKTVEAAHATIRVKGHYKRDNAYLRTRNPATSIAARAKISTAKKRHNWMRGRVGPLHHLWKGGKIWWRGVEWDTLKRKVRLRDRNRCRSCLRTNRENIRLFGAPLQVDHIIPYRQTRDNRMSNLQALCNPCHGKKSGRGL